MGDLTPDIAACSGRISRITDALRILSDARRYAEQVERDPWDFAEEISSLRRAGLSNSDLRWLICNRLLEHGRESTKSGCECRQFRHDSSLRFTKKSCFVLTDAGLAYLEAGRPQFDHEQPELVQKPTWDRDLQELRLGDVIVKQFKVPAPNQETVLAVFEEEGWPVCIDDPLAPVDHIDPKRRLHDTINSLNRNQRNHSVRFHGNGSGNGIRWQLARGGSV